MQVIPGRRGVHLWREYVRHEAEAKRSFQGLELTFPGLIPPAGLEYSGLGMRPSTCRPLLRSESTKATNISYEEHWNLSLRTSDTLLCPKYEFLKN